jgi:hypothetical protein
VEVAGQTVRLLDPGVDGALRLVLHGDAVGDLAVRRGVDGDAVVPRVVQVLLPAVGAEAHPVQRAAVRRLRQDAGELEHDAVEQDRALAQTCTDSGVISWERSRDQLPK